MADFKDILIDMSDDDDTEELLLGAVEAAVKKAAKEVKGQKGARGEAGMDGKRGNRFLGRFQSPDDLPSSAMAGDYAYIVSTGELWYAWEHGEQEPNPTGV